LGKLITAPSGALVEIKEVKKGITLVYQLDKNNKRIPTINIKGENTFLIGIITNSKLNYGKNTSNIIYNWK
jgi:hypothetical protein